MLHVGGFYLFAGELNGSIFHVASFFDCIKNELFINSKNKR